MKPARRTLLIAGSLVLVAPHLAAAQALSRPARVGFLGSASEKGYADRIAALRAGLRELGYVEGRNIRIEYRWAEGQYERLGPLAAELIALKVDVLVTHGTPGSLAAKRATTTIPIVLATSGDPVAAGIVASLARPEGNITGSAFFVTEVVQKRLELLKEALPRAVRVAVLVNPANPSMPRILEAMEGAATPLGLVLQRVEAGSASELERAFSSLKASRADAVLVYEDAVLIANAAAVASLANKLRLPSVGFTEVADAGGLMSYSVDQVALYRRTAAFVDKILKGAKPRDLPIERGSKFDLVVNLRTARALGVSLPRSVLARADRVIE